jgi:excisionase family DNA binding protein
MTNRNTPTERLLTTGEAAASLGCHPETLRRAIRNGTLTCYRFGGCVRLSPDHLKAFMDKALCPARDPNEQSLNDTEADGASSGGTVERVAAFRREQRMNAALDSPSRISKPSLNVIR